MKAASLTGRAAVVSIALFLAFILGWHLATRGAGPTQAMDPEYAKLMGVTATQGKSAMPGPADVGAKLWFHLKRPFYDNGPNDKGVGIQLNQLDNGTVVKESDIDATYSAMSDAFNTADDELYHLSSYGYTSGLTASYRITDGPLQPGSYRLTLGTGLTDKSGNPLVGPYVRNFSMENLASFTVESRSDDTAATATSLSLIASDSGVRSGYGRGNLWGNSTDQDWFSFTAQAGDLLTLAADAPGNPNNSGLYYYVFNAAGSEISHFNATYYGGYGQMGPLTLPSAGTYRVRVTTYYDYQSEYRFRVTLAPSATVQMESEGIFAPESIGSPASPEPAFEAVFETDYAEADPKVKALVLDVHDLHAWTITSGIPSLSAHVTVTDACLAERGLTRMPNNGIFSVTVPGAVAGWDAPSNVGFPFFEQQSSGAWIALGFVVLWIVLWRSAKKGGVARILIAGLVVLVVASNRIGLRSHKAGLAVELLTAAVVVARGESAAPVVVPSVN